METVPEGVILKGVVKKIYHNKAEGKSKESFTYRVLCNDRFYNVKSKENSLEVGDTFFSTVHVNHYDFMDKKTEQRKQGVSYREAKRLS